MTRFRSFYGFSSRHIFHFALLRATTNISSNKQVHQPTLSITGSHSRDVNSGIKNIDGKNLHTLVLLRGRRRK